MSDGNPACECQRNICAKTHVHMERNIPAQKKFLSPCKIASCECLMKPVFLTLFFYTREQG